MEGTANPRESNHATSLEKRVKGTFNIMTPFGSAHSQDLTSIHSFSNEPLPACRNRKRPKITERNTGEEYLYRAYKRKQLAQGKQKSGHVSQERDDISPNMSGTPGKKPQKATINRQRAPLDPYCNNDQIKDRDPLLLPEASQSLQAEGENTRRFCRYKPDTAAGAKEILPGSPISANSILEDANHISAGAIQTEWADVDPLVQTQTRHLPVVSGAEEYREISKEKDLQEKLTSWERVE